VDFVPIVTTTSPDDALALLLAMYTIFELNFDKNSRAVRFLYAIIFSDKRFLSNSTRILIKEKNIDIDAEQKYKRSSNTQTSSNYDSTIDMDLEAPPSLSLPSPCASSLQQVDTVIATAADESPSSIHANKTFVSSFVSKE
jgi:hypothetical protein